MCETKGKVDNTKRRYRAAQRMMTHAMWYLFTASMNAPMESVWMGGHKTLRDSARILRMCRELMRS